MFNIGLLAPRRASPVGDVILTSTTGLWTCPAGVTSVCVVLVGRGGDGAFASWGNPKGGGGGALTYKNNHAVVPGQAYSYQINTGSSAIFGLQANAGFQGIGESGGPPLGQGGAASPAPGAISYAGGDGRQGNGNLGGGAGRYTRAGQTGESQGVGLYGVDSGNFGAGGTSGVATNGQPGAIRIMWGDGRSFPSNAT